MDILWLEKTFMYYVSIHDILLDCVMHKHLRIFDRALVNIAKDKTISTSEVIDRNVYPYI